MTEKELHDCLHFERAHLGRCRDHVCTMHGASAAGTGAGRTAFGTGAPIGHGLM